MTDLIFPLYARYVKYTKRITIRNVESNSRGIYANKNGMC